MTDGPFTEAKELIAGLARIVRDVGDDLLRLIFTACHPVLSSEGLSSPTVGEDWMRPALCDEALMEIQASRSRWRSVQQWALSSSMR